MFANRLPAVLLLSLATLDMQATSLEALDFLPPTVPWNGKSRELMLPADDPWVTPAEISGLERTPRYEETIAWLRRLADAAPEIDLISIGRSAEGRDIWMVVASTARERDPASLRTSGKPTVLAQAGIHAGEIDGKDAGLMLLRDMTVRGTRGVLLERTNFLFIPILSVDGHERFSAHNRINQRGPIEMGWRTNARNLNLNRDYTKLETEEIRAVVATINAWQPDLYIDLHVTDGADYQYDITWGTTPDFAWSPAISRYLEGVVDPAVQARLRAMDHVPGPLMWPVNDRDFADGNLSWTGTPRFSQIYGAVRHLPSILVENHSLKPYDQRVLGTYLFLESVLDVVGRNPDALREAMARDRSARAQRVTLAWQRKDPPTRKIRTVEAIRAERYDSPISGDTVVRWTGERLAAPMPFLLEDEPAVVVERPAAYYIPAAWSHVAEKLRLHGIAVERLVEPTTIEATMYRLPEARAADSASAFDQRGALYEGRVRIEPGKLIAEQATVELPAGSFRAGTDQPLGDLLVLLLEPESPDSLFQWGFFLEILTRAEYAEPYVMEPMARAMLEADAALARQFEAKLESDPEFAGNADARLEWFYRRSPYFDSRDRLYPIARAAR